MNESFEKKKALLATELALSNSEREKEPYFVSMFGKKFKVLPGVFSPKYFDDAKFFGKCLPKIVGNKSLLEVGCGTGILAILCAIKGAKVSATDINSQAVKNTKENAKLHNVKIDTRKGDLFSTFGRNERFDFIFWNHPFGWTKKTPETLLARSVFDRKYASLKRYFADAKKHLNQGGILLLGTSSLASLGLIKTLARNLGYKIKLISKSKKEFIESDFPIDLRIYALTLQNPNNK